MPYRVVQWSTGNVGRHSLAGIHAHPEIELVGVFVSNPGKVGHDAGELAGLVATFGGTKSRRTYAQMTPTPSQARPPDSTSSVVTCLARMPGNR